VPLFEFHCKKCGHVFEELLSVAERDRGDIKCPVCRSGKIAQGMSAFATGGSAAGSSGGGIGGGCGSGGFT